MPIDQSGRQHQRAKWREEIDVPKQSSTGTVKRDSEKAGTDATSLPTLHDGVSHTFPHSRDPENRQAGWVQLPTERCGLVARGWRFSLGTWD